ncbi:hypothetical protein TrVE_jg1400 [Triparma verrucosa]|uniref:CRAL-TRIO domain-containing protein n=1 Tax=Triparma verrucosa TaxID=1606542 RepID=A0A9W7FQ48_9STRA|nr:hypothetical protein TrVE_jg1400 [Triparma verrucosa]
MESAELELVTEEERDQIEDLRAELMDLISGHGAGSSQAQLHKDDGTLLRFIQARSTVDESAAMYRESMRWREEVKIDEIWASRQGRREDMSKVVQLAEKVFYGTALSGEHGSTLEGGPIMFDRMGKVDLNCIASCPGLEDEVCNSYMAYLEGVWRKARSCKGGRGKALVVVDLSGLSTSHLRHIGIIKRIAQIGPPRYPETTCGVALIRGPWVLSGVYKIISPILPENTRRKIMIWGSDYLAKLREKLPEEHIPTYIGGTKWAGEQVDHPAALIMEKSQTIELADWEKAVEEEALAKAMEGASLEPGGKKGDFVVEKQDEDIDLSEVPGGQIRFKGARNSIVVTKEEAARLRGGEKETKGNFVVEKQDSNINLSEVPGGQIRFQGARNSISVTKEAVAKIRQQNLK